MWRFQWLTRYFWVAGDWLKGVVAHLNVIMTLYKRLGQRWVRGGRLSLCRDWVGFGWAFRTVGLMSRGYRGTHEMWGIGEIIAAFRSISVANYWTVVFCQCYTSAHICRHADDHLYWPLMLSWLIPINKLAYWLFVACGVSLICCDSEEIVTEWGLVLKRNYIITKWDLSNI